MPLHNPKLCEYFDKTQDFFLLKGGNKNNTFGFSANSPSKKKNNNKELFLEFKKKFKAEERDLLYKHPIKKAPNVIVFPVRPTM